MTRAGAGDAAGDAAVTGVAAVTLLVADLARSARWYADLLGLDYLREFRVDGRLWGVVLLHRPAGFVLLLQARETEPEARVPDGFRPVVLAAPSREFLDAMADRCRRLGAEPRGPSADPDGSVLDVTDPDGMILRFRHVTADTGGPGGKAPPFLGITYDADAAVTGTYDTPALGLPPSRTGDG